MRQPTLGPDELKAALPLLYALSAITSVCSLALILGGVYIAIVVPTDPTVKHDMTFAGAKISTSSVGLGMAFLGAAALVYLASKLLKTMFDVTALSSAKPPSGLPPAPGPR